MRLAARVQTITGAKVLLADEFVYQRDGWYDGDTWCGHAIARVLAPFETDDQGPADHRPVDCSRCLGWAKYRADWLLAVMEGER